MGRNQRRGLSKSQKFYNRQREQFSATIAINDQQRDDLAMIQEYYNINNLEVFESALDLFIEDRKEMIRIESGSTQVNI